MSRDTGQIIRDLRENAGLTREQLAERSDVSVETIRKLEQGAARRLRLGAGPMLTTALAGGVTAGGRAVSRGRDEVSRVGPAIQAAEQQAARRRILDQAEAERTPLDDTTRVVPDRRRRREQR